MSADNPSENPELWLPITEGNPIREDEFVPPSSVVEPLAASADAPTLDLWEPQGDVLPPRPPQPR